MVWPAGIPRSVSEERLLLSPDRALAVTVRLGRAMFWPGCSEKEPDDQDMLGGSGSTLIGSLTVVVRPSLPDAKNVSEKFVSFVEVRLRPESVHVATSREVLPADAVNVLPWPSLSVAPIGTLLINSEFRSL